MSRDVLTSAKRIKDIQKSVFTPTKLPHHTGQRLRAHETTNAWQPKVLNLVRDQAVDTKVL